MSDAHQAIGGNIFCNLFNLVGSVSFHFVGRATGRSEGRIELKGELFLIYNGGTII